MALSKEHRLVKKDSEYVLRNGETVKNIFFFIRFLKNRVDRCRLAILVSVKVLKNSTARNHLRRMVAEIFKTTDIWSQALDIVFVATSGIVGKPSGEIKSGLMDAINTIFVKQTLAAKNNEQQPNNQKPIAE